MSAPSSSRLALALAVLVAGLLGAGCTVPGSSRLQGPPEGLAPSLEYVTADVLGFTLYDTDPASKRWSPLASVAGEGDENLALQALHAPITGGEAADLEEVGSWVGDHAGVAIRELHIDDRTDATTLYFADVRDKDALREILREHDWRLAKRVPDGPATRFVRSDGDYRAAALFDDAVLAARTPDALDTFLEAADEYAVPERRAMSEFAVESSERVPLAFVFRFDLVRTQVRRPFEDDPAMLEFARWATDSNVLVALRDGWLGLAPAAEGRAGEARIVGAAEWVPDLAPDITLEPATRGRLGQLPAEVDAAVALHDPGQHLRELVRAITVGAGQYATEQDVPDAEERVELLPVLDALDGQAAVGWDADARTVTMNVATDDAGDVARDVEAALELGGLRGDASPAGDGVVLDARFAGGAKGEAGGATGSLDTRALASAGTPPRDPVAWFWARGGACIGQRAGWITFDGTERMTLGLGIELEQDCPGTPAGPPDPHPLLDAFAIP